MNLHVQAIFWLGALLLLLLFLWVFSGILLPFILGMALAYLLDPLADRLERGGMSRFWATITIVVLTVLVLTLVRSHRDPAARLPAFGFSRTAAGLRRRSCRRSETVFCAHGIGQIFGSAAARRPERRSDGVAGRCLDRHRGRARSGPAARRSSTSSA